MLKKIFVGLGVVLVLFILFIWWGSTIETPEVGNISGEDVSVVEQIETDFTTDKGNFSVYFGGAPRYTPGTLTVSTGETYPTHLYQYTASDGSIWQAFYAQYPESSDVSNPENVLLNTVKGTESSVAGKIVSTKTGVYQSFPSIDYVISIPEQKYMFKGRNVLSGHKIYSMAYIFDEGKELSSEKFFNSLKIEQ